MIARSKRVHDKALRLLRDTILRDQNHPSVFAWSVANEPDVATPRRASRSTSARRSTLVHEMDPSRLAAVDLAGYPSIAAAAGLARVRRDRAELVLRLVPRPERRAGRPRGPARPSSTRRTPTGPTRRCSSRSSAPRPTAAARSTRRAPTSSSPTCCATTWTSTTRRTRSSTARSSGSCATSACSPAGTASTPSRRRRCSRRAWSTSTGNMKPAFDDVSQMFGDTPPLR